MATVIQIKRSTGTTAPAELAQGELAYTYGTGTQGNNGDRLFIGTGTETDGVAANIDVIGGKYFTQLTDHALGTLTASSALLVDSNKAIDEIFIGNSSTVGGTLKLNEGTNNGTNFIGLKAPNAVTADTTFTLPDGDGTNGQFLKTDGSGNLSFGTVVTTLSLAADTGSSDSVSTGETITFTGGEGIDTSVTDNTITIAAEDATDTNKGIASFDATDFTVSSGDVTLNAERVQDIAGAMFGSNTETLITATYQDADGTIDLVVDNDLSNYDNTTSAFITASSTDTLTNKTINASQLVDSSVTNAKLANNSVSFTDESSTAGSVSLGGTLEFLTGEGINTTASGNTLTIAAEDASTSNKGVASFDTNDFTVSSGAVSIKSGSIENGDLAGSIANAKLTNSTITVAGDSGSNAVDLGDTLTVQGTTNEIETSVSGDTITVGLPDDVTVGNNLTVTGDLTVNGTTTTLATTNSTVTDTLIELGNGITGTPGNDSGIVIERGDADNAFIGFDDSADKFIVGTGSFTGASTGNLTISTGTIVANLEATTATVGGSNVTTTDNTQTLTNKTIDASSNTISNIANSSLTNSAISFTDESSTAGSVSLGGTLEFLTGEGIDTTASGSTITIAAELATTSNKGVASFSSDNFTVTSGAVTVTTIDGGTF